MNASLASIISSNFLHLLLTVDGLAGFLLYES